jgi:outer membrane protein
VPVPSPTALASVDSSDAGLADERLRAGARQPTLPFLEAIALVLRNNPQRTAAAAAQRAAQARVGTARSAGGPQVGLTGGVSVDRSFGGNTGGSVSSGTGNGTGGFSGGNGSRDGFQRTENLGIAADLPIYTGGRVRASTRAAQAAARAQAAQARQVEQDLVLDAATTYLGILRSEQLLTVEESNLAVSRERLRVAQVRYAAGASALLDVRRAETTLADAAQRRITASTTVAQAKAALNTLMGRAPETPFRVISLDAVEPTIPLGVTPGAGIVPGVGTSSGIGTTSGTTLTPGVGTAPNTPIASGTTTASGVGTTLGVVTTSPGYPPLPGASSEALRAQAERSAPSLEVAREQVRAAEANVDVARSQRRPSFGLSLTGLLRNPVTFASRFALGLGVNLAQTLFDSGRARSQTTEARNLLEQSRAQLGTQRLTVANDIDQLLLSLDAAEHRLNSTDTAVIAAQEALRATQVGYEAGVRTSVEVSDAQAALLAAQTQAVNARFDLALSRAQVTSAAGALSEQWLLRYEAALRNELAQVRK